MMRLAGVIAIVNGFLVVHSLINRIFLRRPTSTSTVVETVSILVPARNEELNIRVCVDSLLKQESLTDFEVIVLDDDSTDSTGEILTQLQYEHLKVITSTSSELPADWLGKPWACQRLSEQARGSVLVFVDADVVLEHHAIAATVNEMRNANLELLSAQPRQVAVTWLERLIQPLLGWSWLTSLPLLIAEKTRLTIFSAAIGQFIVVDAAAYRRMGGHETVHNEVIDDINLLRAIKRNGGRGTIANGSTLATCRMYRNSKELLEGYGKSFHKAFGGLLGTLGLLALFAVLYLYPAIGVWGAADRGWFALSLVLAALTRLIAALSFRDRLWPELLLHPLAILAFLGLNLHSWQLRVSGKTFWKGRAL